MSTHRIPVLLLASLPGLALAQGTPAPFPGNDHSYGISGSADLGVVAFASSASNLVRNDTNGQPDVFVFDAASATVRRASVDANGIQGDGPSRNPHLSANGRFLVFDTLSSNLGAPSRGPRLKDLQTGQLTVISTFFQGFTYPRISDDGSTVVFDGFGTVQLFNVATGQVTPITSGGFFSDLNPVVSASGRYVAFASGRSNLASGDSNGVTDVYRFDRQATANAFLRVSVASTGAEGNADSGGSAGGSTFLPRPIAISGNGNVIVFSSLANNLANDSFGARGGLFLRDVSGIAFTRKLASCGFCNPPFSTPAFTALDLSPDARWLSFYASNSFDESATGTSRAPGYYRMDLTSGVATPLGERGTANVIFDSFVASVVSDDGATVALQTSEALPGIDDRARFADIVRRPAASATHTLASRALLGAPSDGHSRKPALSGDGRRVVYASFATDLYPSDTNGVRDIVLRDTAADTLALVSASAAGVAGNADADFPSLSGDGRFAAFWSSASNLVPGDTPGSGDVFVKDLASGAIERVSAGTPGTAGPSALSQDGRWVAFSTFEFVYLWDRQTQTRTLASPTLGGAAPSPNCSLCETYPLSISDDGRYVTFQSRAGNLVAGQVDDGGDADIFVFDRVANALELVGRAAGASGVEANGSNLAPSISGDGRYVAWWSSASNLGGTTGQGIWLRDRTLGTTTRVGSSPAPTNFIGTEPGPTVSRDGNWVAFVSTAASVVPGDSNQLPDLFLWRRAGGATTRASLTPAWTQANGSSYVYELNNNGHPRFYGVALSRDAGVVAFGAAANNLAPGDDNAADDVFVLQRSSQAIALASAPPLRPSEDDMSAPRVSRSGRIAVATKTDRVGALGGSGAGGSAKGGADKWSSIAMYNFTTNQEQPVDVSTIGAPADADSFFPSVSPSGTQVTFASDATNLGPAPDVDAQTDIFVRDTTAGVTVPITANADAGSGETATTEVGSKWSAVFESEATNLPGAASANGAQDIFVAVEGAVENTFSIQPVSVPNGGGSANGPSSDPSISENGRFVAFASLANNLLPGDANGVSDIFVRDLNPGGQTVQLTGTGLVQPNGASAQAEIANPTASTWVVAFESEASNLVPGDVNNDTDVFVRTSGGTVELISRGLGGLPANGKSFNPSISPDGRHVSFVSTADNLVAGDTNNAPDVFAFDRLTLTMVRLSVGVGGQQANDFSLQPAVGLNPNGTPVVVFDTPADNIVPFDEDEAIDIFMVDASNGAIDSTGEVIFRWSFED